jgi:hypothetical protein
MRGLEVRNACRPVALPLPLPSRFYKRDLEVGSWKCDILDQSTSTKLPIGTDLEAGSGLSRTNVRLVRRDDSGKPALGGSRDREEQR